MSNPSRISSPVRFKAAASKESGFTLLEIMVALAILGGVIVTALVSINYHLSVMDGNIETTMAAMLARGRLAEISLGERPTGKSGHVDPPYDGFSWRYKRERSDYKDIWNESLTVRRDGSTAVTMETMTTE